MKEVYILSAVRTPVGSFGGGLKEFSAIDLGCIATKEAIKRSNIDGEIIDEVIIGNVLNGGLGQGPARQVGVKAGLNVRIPATTINKLCGSGLKAVSMGAQAILAGDADVIVAGGMESMSRAPYVMDAFRWGQRMGNGNVIDTMIIDGLTDAFNNYHMGITAENVAQKWNISREEQDQFALKSQNKAESAILSGKFEDEIVKVEYKTRKGEVVTVDKDEHPRFGSKIENFSKLKPAFKKDGTVTAGNASGLNDGAAMVVIASGEKVKEMNLKPLVKIVSYASEGLDPSIMGYGPVGAIKKALKKANLNIEDIDLFEINEAFAAQSLAVLKDLNLDPEKVNVNGGAIALGHPIGASGSRVLVTLIHEMIRRGVKRGIASLCIGGGMGIAMIVERV